MQTLSSFLEPSSLTLIAMVLLAAWVLTTWHRNDDKFDLRWLLVDTNTEKVSLMKLGQFVALCVSTWVLIHETRSGKLTEWLYAGYILTWAGVNLGNKWISGKQGGTP